MKDYPVRHTGGCAYIAKPLEDRTWNYCNAPVRLPGESWCKTHRAIVYIPTRPANSRPLMAAPDAPSRNLQILDQP